MNTHLKKLIAVIDSCHLILYEAQGYKIMEGPLRVALAFIPHERREKDHGSYDQAFGYSIGGAPPHTMPKEIDHQNAAKLICAHLDSLFFPVSQYSDLIITAEPKMLGYIRKNLSEALQKKVTKEVHKDLVEQEKDAVEHAVFDDDAKKKV